MQNEETEYPNKAQLDEKTPETAKQSKERSQARKQPRNAGKETIVVTVKFRNAGKQYDFDTNGLELNCQDQVVVETSRGRALGTVVRSPRNIVDIGKRPQELKKVIRIATEADINMTRISRAKEDEAFAFCNERIKKRNLPMNLVKADYLFDGSKILFHFTAENRIDFRELVKDLAHHFHTRIEMRQIGVRDEAKLIGGLGICGRELCCSTFITEFQPVSVKMAKQQGLALNPSKISGQCGRLLCCLGYEYDTYCSMAKKLPKTGRKVQYDGQETTVVAVNILAQSVTLRLEGKNVEVPVDALSRSKGSEAHNTSKSGKQEQRNQGSPSGERRGRGGKNASKGNRVTVHTKASQAEPRTDESVPDKDSDKTTSPRPEGKKNRSGTRRGRQKPRPSSKQVPNPNQEGKAAPPSSAESKSDTSPPQGKGEKPQEQKNQKRRPPRRRNKRRPKPKPKT